MVLRPTQHPQCPHSRPTHEHRTKRPPQMYLYPHDYTHVTAAAPAPFTNTALASWTEAEKEDYTARWRDALRDTCRAGNSAGAPWPSAPFPLIFSSMELHDGCAIIKVEDPTGGVAAVRQCFAAAARHSRLADGGVGEALMARSGYKAPNIVHSTVMRIVAGSVEGDAVVEEKWKAAAALWKGPVTVMARECTYLVEGVAYQHITPGTGVIEVFPYA